MVRLQTEPIDPGRLLAEVASHEAGGIALFLGTVRSSNRGRRVVRLEYEAYRPMAERTLARIGGEARERFGCTAVAIVHRTGRLELGEVSVAVAAAAAHRAQAFEACRFALDELKARAPIWKKELFVGGEAWIEGPGEGGRRQA